MKTQNKKHTAALIAILTIGVLNASAVQAEATENGGVIYNDRAYTPAIQSYPNAVVDRNADSAKIIFVDQSAGPAIYSYPGNIALQTTDFNVEYVSTAYGPAIYSYPNNNVKHHLRLVENGNAPDDQQFITPVSITVVDNPVKALESSRLDNNL